MTHWHPDKIELQRPAFRALAEQFAEAIQGGMLEPGERLPSQRDLASELNLSLQTVSRAYEELRRRNLVQGEVGRGTFVRARHLLKKMPFQSIRMAESIAELSIFKPVVDVLHEKLIKNTFTELGNDAQQDMLFSFRPNEGLARHNLSAVEWLRWCGLELQNQQVIITNGATQGSTTALLTASKPGGTIATEAIGLHSLSALCSFLGMKITGIEVDRYGIRPDAFEKTCKNGDINALYMIPTLASPTGYLMPLERRLEIVKIARTYGVLIIENDVLGPLVANKPSPIAALAPERTFYVTSFTKCLMPGLRSGYLVVPQNAMRAARNRLLATTWMATPLTAEIASRWIQDGTARRLLLWQRKALLERHRIVNQLLEGLSFTSHPNALHIWLKLSGRWRSNPFAEQALEQGVAIAPSDPFLIDYESDVRAVRISLGAAEVSELKRGLRVIKQLMDRETEFTLTPF